MLFTARNLSKRYTAGTGGCTAFARVLAGVDLELEAGELVGVVGDRGSGKTTLVRCVAGLARPDAGAIHWSPSARHAPITMLAPAARPYETVRDVVHRACNDALVAPDRLAAALARLGLDRLLARSQAALTTDERARLALVVAVATRHPLLLLDGTADAFASGMRSAVRAELERHVAAGGAVLVTGRDGVAVAALVPRVWHLADGRLRAVDAIDSRPHPARVAEPRAAPSIR